MAKPDVRRDYYADLGLAPSAEGEDIKKQFRKLALKYHPDKNRGAEEESKAKFQTIKIAHDLLSNPEQRLKYDTDRLRAGYGKVSGPPKTNSTRGSQPTASRPTFPWPQYNPPPPFTKSQPKPNGPFAGTKRYKARAHAGTQSWNKAQDEGGTREDAFKGSSEMRGAFDPATGCATPRAPRQQNQSFGKSRPQSAYERFQNYMKTQNPPTSHSPKKRNGYAPGEYGGDEPMARNTSAYTSSSRPSSIYFDPASPPTGRKPPVSEDPQSTAEYERTRSRYAVTGGEKTFVTGSGLGHSSTVRNPLGGYQNTSTRNGSLSSTLGQHQHNHSSSPMAARNRTDSVPEISSDIDEDPREEKICLDPVPESIPKKQLRQRQTSSDPFGQNDSNPNIGKKFGARQASTSPVQPPMNPTTVGNKVRSGPKPARVATEEEESRETINIDSLSKSTTPLATEAEVKHEEARDLHDELSPVHPTSPSGHNSASRPKNTDNLVSNGNTTANPSSTLKETTPSTMGNGTSKSETSAPLYGIHHRRKTDSGVIEDLGYVFANLSFDSQSAQEKATKPDTRPREIDLPNSPELPQAPEPVPLHPGSTHLMIPRDKSMFYISRMSCYMHEWNHFNRRMLLHFNTRQNAIETDLAPSWTSAMSDTTRLRVDNLGDDSDPDKGQVHADSGAIGRDEFVLDRWTGRYSAYLRAIEEDKQLRKHWEVACEMHRKCILDLGRFLELISQET